MLVNNKPASVVAVTLAEAVGAWLASPQRAAADLGGAIADINADVHSGEAYEEGSAYLGAELELEEDVYAESTDEVHTAVVGHSTYQLASARPARPARLSSGRQNLFREASNVMELDPISPRWDDTGDTGEACTAPRPRSVPGVTAAWATSRIAKKAGPSTRRAHRRRRGRHAVLLLLF